MAVVCTGFVVRAAPAPASLSPAIHGSEDADDGIGYVRGKGTSNGRTQTMVQWVRYYRTELLARGYEMKRSMHLLAYLMLVLVPPVCAGFMDDRYVTNKSLDGLFYLVGQEETKIRKDPAARVTDLLKTVFGGK